MAKVKEETKGNPMDDLKAKLNKDYGKGTINTL